MLDKIFEKKYLNSTSQVFSLIALLSLFSLPILVSWSLSSSSLVGSSNPTIIYNLPPVESSSGQFRGQDVLGVSDSNLPLNNDLSDYVFLNTNDLYGLFPKVAQSLTSENYSLRFQYSGNLTKQKLLTIINDSQVSSVSKKFNINFIYDLGKNTRENRSSRALYIGETKFVLGKDELPSNVVLLPGEQKDIYLELSNTSLTDYKLEISF